MKFLIIASDHNKLLRLRSWLQEGYPNCDIVTALNDNEALKMLQDTDVDLVTVANGIELVQLCQDIRSLSDAPLIVLGNAQNSKTAVEAIQAGCDFFVAEPVNRMVFIAYIEALMRRASTHNDLLTQLPNMRWFERVITQEIERGRRYNHPFSLVVIDISGFNRLPEECTVAIPYRIFIRNIASILKANVRSADILVKSGSCQFLVLMPESDHSAALKLIDRLQQALNAWCAERGLLDKGVRVEYGMSSCFPGKEGDMAALLREARQYLISV